MVISSTVLPDPVPVLKIIFIPIHVLVLVPLLEARQAVEPTHLHLTMVVVNQGKVGLQATVILFTEENTHQKLSDIPVCTNMVFMQVHKHPTPTLILVSIPIPIPVLKVVFIPIHVLVPLLEAREAVEPTHLHLTIVVVNQGKVMGRQATVILFTQENITHQKLSDIPVCSNMVFMQVHVHHVILHVHPTPTLILVPVLLLIFLKVAGEGVDPTHLHLTMVFINQVMMGLQATAMQVTQGNSIIQHIKKPIAIATLIVLQQK